MCCYLPAIEPRMTSRRAAFTLIELLVVIGVIALIMGILMPVLGRAKNIAKRTACRSNLRQIGVAFRTYLDDNRDIMPPACALPWYITDTNDTNYRPPITKFLGPLLQRPKVFICNADTAQKYYLRVGGTSYYYNGRQEWPFIGWIDGLGGTTISASRFAQDGVKERNINVMSDFDRVHPRRGELFGWKNYLYADWHVSDYKNQD
jgi:prepilin-type N-terminal cleavage/methylation domain-containing protein/prepilin-type processing-associated H-X9-DG protein